MIQKNRYYRHSKISEAKLRQLLRYFAMDLTATDCAELSGISVRSVNAIYLRVRRRLAEHCEQVLPLGGELEADESYFGPRRVRGLRGRGAGGKTVVFGLLKRGQNVYTEIVPNASKAVLQAIIRGKADIASVIHTDRWRGYDGLVDVGFDKHLRVNHGNNEFARGNVHVNGIESFWSYAKRRLGLIKWRAPAHVLPASEGNGIPLQSAPSKPLPCPTEIAQKQPALITSAS